MQGNWQTLLAANLSVALGAAVQGTVGYGMNLIAVPLLLSIDASLVPAPLLLAHLLLVTTLTSMDVASIHRISLRTATIASILGTAAGVYALDQWSHRTSTISTALVLIACTALAGLRIPIALSRRNVFVAGLISGFCGTTSAINGPPLAAAISKSLNPTQVRATLASFLLLSTLASLAGLASVRRFSAESGLLAASLVPGVLIGVFVARSRLLRLANRLEPRYLFFAASSLATTIFIGRELLADF